MRYERGNRRDQYVCCFCGLKVSATIRNTTDNSFQGPLQLCRHVKYPPVYQAMGTNDEIFDISQVNHFHHALESQGIPCKKVILPGLLHAFDVREDVGSEIHLNVLRPAVRWVVDHAEVKGD